MAQELAILALGMITQPNEMGQYPVGALKVAQDVFIRAPGIIELSKSAATLQTLSATSTHASEVLVPSDVEMLCIDGSVAFGWEVQWFSASTTAVVAMPYTFPGKGLTNWTRSRDRFFVTSSNGPIAFDYAAPTSTAERTPRLAGLYAPFMLAYRTAGTGNALAANVHCSVICLVKRIYADGYELISAMSFPCDTGSVLSGSATDLEYQIYFDAKTESPVKVGDIVEVYRTRSQSIGAAATGGTVGGVSCDSTYYLTLSHTLIAGETGSVTIDDATPDTGLGRQAYTNPGIGGGEATYISPPVAPITVTFKGHTFLFNITEAAQVELQALGGIGYATLTDPASWRANIVGTREFTGTYTNGSRTITAISAAHMVGIVAGQTLADGVFGPSQIIIASVTASTITLSSSGPTATGSGTKTFTTNDTITVDGSVGSYNSNSGNTSLADVMWGMRNGGILGGGFSTETKSDVFQAASLSYFSGAFRCSPTPSRFSIAKSRAIQIGGGLSTLSVNATNGNNYQPTLPAPGASPKVYKPITTPNGFAWSEAQQPDAWPPANRSHVGSGRVLAAVATPDAIWVDCTDGLWRISGDGGEVGAEGYDWRADLIDSTLITTGPQAMCVLRDTVYMYSGRGFASIDDRHGINDRLSEGVIGDQLPGVPYSDTGAIQLRADEDKDEIWVIIGNVARVWSYLTKTWVRNTQLTSSGNSSYAYWRTIAAIVMANDTLSAARYINNAGNSSPVGFVTYQPIFGGDPFATKQFIDTTWVWDPAVDGFTGMAPNYNGGAYFPFFVQPALVSTDLRVTFQVPRNSPAIGQSLAIGMQFFGSGARVPKLWGLRLRYVPIGEQQTRRQA